MGALIALCWSPCASQTTVWAVGVPPGAATQQGIHPDSSPGPSEARKTLVGCVCTAYAARYGRVRPYGAPGFYFVGTYRSEHNRLHNINMNTVFLSGQVAMLVASEALL